MSRNEHDMGMERKCENVFSIGLHCERYTGAGVFQTTGWGAGVSEFAVEKEYVPKYAENEADLKELLGASGEYGLQEPVANVMFSMFGIFLGLFLFSVYLYGSFAFQAELFWRTIERSSMVSRMANFILGKSNHIVNIGH